MICSSLNGLRFIVRTLFPVAGLYPNLQEFAGLMCGRPPRGKVFWCDDVRSGAVMCPACSCGTHDRWP